MGRFLLTPTKPVPQFKLFHIKRKRHQMTYLELAVAALAVIVVARFFFRAYVAVVACADQFNHK